MDVTTMTWVVAITGAALILLLSVFQIIALVRPRSAWTIENIYGGSPDSNDSEAYFAFNQGYAWVDTYLWAPLQLAGSVGMVVGERWGFLLALMASVPYVYSAVNLLVWDRALGFQKETVQYWVVWGMWPAFGLFEGVYCFLRLSGSA